jgi:hypothetical protein
MGSASNPYLRQLAHPGGDAGGEHGELSAIDGRRELREVPFEVLPAGSAARSIPSLTQGGYGVSNPIVAPAVAADLKRIKATSV